MFTRIMVPVDLRHLDKLKRALDVSAQLSKANNAPIVYVAVTSNTPSELAHNPAEFAAKVRQFANDTASAYGIESDIHVIASHDPTTDVDDALLRAVRDTGSDLVVMASHKPGLAEYFWPSNGGKVASHSDASVLVVRDN